MRDLVDGHEHCEREEEEGSDKEQMDPTSVVRSCESRGGGTEMERGKGYPAELARRSLRRRRQEMWVCKLDKVIVLHAGPKDQAMTPSQNNT